ncbi:MAG: hypothetical protein LBJ74_01680, partial [Heliobacteriaceae bacterium]|nr:hypothetical protein [Heliobacteriaceae bacterium]
MGIPKISIQAVQSLRSILSKPQNLRGIKTLTYPRSGKTFNLLSLENKNPDIAYHGSPFNFDFFDPAKIGTGEGMNKYGRGLYLSFKKRIMPYYANIRNE